VVLVSKPTLERYEAEHARLKDRLEAAQKAARVAAMGVPDDARALEVEIARLAEAVRWHIESETRIIHPLLEEVFPEARETLENQHQVVAELTGHLEEAFGLVRRTQDGARSFEILLQRFVAALLPHIAEEEALMPLLRELAGRDALEEALEGLDRPAKTPRR
jgi:hemerythrin-like domain-containing protein